MTGVNEEGKVNQFGRIKGDALKEEGLHKDDVVFIAGQYQVAAEDILLVCKTNFYSVDNSKYYAVAYKRVGVLPKHQQEDYQLKLREENPIPDGEEHTLDVGGMRSSL